MCRKFDNFGRTKLSEELVWKRITNAVLLGVTVHALYILQKGYNEVVLMSRFMSIYRPSRSFCCTCCELILVLGHKTSGNPDSCRKPSVCVGTISEFLSLSYHFTAWTIQLKWELVLLITPWIM